MERRLPQFFFALSLLALVLIVAAVWQASTPIVEDLSAAVSSAGSAGRTQRGDQGRRSGHAAGDSPDPAAGPAARGPLHHVPSRRGRPHHEERAGALPLSRRTRAARSLQVRLHHLPRRPGSGHRQEERARQRAFWQKPLLSRDYIRASCGRCHKEGDVPGVPELTEGRRLFETAGLPRLPQAERRGRQHRAGPDRRGRKPPLARVAGAAFPGSQRGLARLRHAQLPLHQGAGARADVLHALAHQRRDGHVLLERAADSRAPRMAGNCSSKRTASPAIPSAAWAPRPAPICSASPSGTRSEWLDEQLVNPQLVYPGSTMPEYDLETNARKALIAFMAIATPEDAQAILSGQDHALSLPKTLRSKRASRTSRALVASAATARNCRAACPTPTPRAARCLRFCMSPTTTPRTKSSQSFATARCLPWITRPARRRRSYMPSWKTRAER